MVTRLHELQGKTLKKLKVYGVGAVAVAIVVVVSGIADRVHSEEVLKKWTLAQAIPSVDLISPQKEDSQFALVLPGSLQAFYDAPIHARVSGYLKRWYTDIGTPVKAGQVLATIDTPELDQQLAQAQANLVTAEANRSLAGVTATRWKRLLSDDAVSPQEVDEKNGDLEAKTALVKAAKANVDRLQALTSFKQIVAPFDGIVTSRKTDIGALIGAGGENGPALFTVSDIHKLRVYVRVPQSNSAVLRTGVAASLHVPEYPDKTFEAAVESNANAVNDQSGTVLVELLLDNSGNLLKPGGYTEVHFKLPRSTTTWKVPVSALIFRQEGMQVATVGKDNRVLMKSVRVAHDAGTYVEISSGLSAEDRIVDNPPDSIANGDVVNVRTVNQKR